MKTDVEDWCDDSLQKLFHLAQDRGDWKKNTKLTLDTYEHHTSIWLMAMDLRTMPSGDFEKGKRLFKESCAQCHTVAKNGRHMLGPNLHGVVGRGAAQAQGYYYTEAAKTKGIIWTKEALCDFLRQPFEFLPGTRMVFFGLQKESDRADIITYLEDSSK